MNKLLNRFAWVISISFGFIITFSIIGLLSGTVRSDDVFFSIFWGVGAGLMIKKIIFSSVFIEERVRHFAEALGDNYFKKTSKEITSEIPIVGDTFQESHIENDEIEIETEIGKGINDDFTTGKIEYDSKMDNELSEEKFETVQSVAHENLEKEEKVEYVPSTFDIYAEKILTYIKDFFATNTLAKIGGILLFLAVVYFLKGVAGYFWEVIGSVGRLIIGFLVGFSTLGIGVFLHKKGSENEGLILVGLSILINYAVILSGRYLIGENSLGEDGFLTESITFFLLILNTIFGVVTSLVYQSRTLLIFSFVFAYFNPFIIGAESTGSPNTLVFYSLIISFGGLILSKLFSGEKFIKSEIGLININIILTIAFVFGNIVILVAPFSESFGWITKILSSVILSMVSIYSYYQNLTRNNLNGIVQLFLVSYVFVILHIIAGGLINDILSSFSSSLLYIIILLSYFTLTVTFIGKIKKSFGVSEPQSGTFSLLQLLLFVPIILFATLILSNAVFSVTLLFVLTILTYLVGFIFLQNTLSSLSSYVYFVVLSTFIFFADLSLVDGKKIYDFSVFLTVIGTSFIFLFSSYYFSLKKGLTKLYSIGTIGGILTLAPAIVSSHYTSYEPLPEYYDKIQAIEGTLILISAFAVGFFALSNWILPFINKHLLNNKKNLGNLILGSIAGVLFIAFELWNFGNEFFPGIALGFGFTGLAIIYFIQSFFIVQKIGSLNSLSQNKNDQKSLKNIFYTYAGISLSLFSLAIAFIFSKYPEIVSTVWLFEATILYYFYSQNKEWKLLFVGNVLFAIGIFQLGYLIDIVDRGDYTFLVSFGVICSSLILNIRFIDKIKSFTGNIIHYILHIVGIGILAILLSIIIVSSGQGWSSFGILIFITVIGFFYSLLKVDFLKWFFVFVLGVFCLYHIGGVESVFSRIDRDGLSYLKILQYFVSVMLILNYFIWKKYNFVLKFNRIILAIISFYIFIISNIYILDLFEVIVGHFALTIYWGLLASFLLFYGIVKDIIKLRTIGLYFIVLTSLKVFGYDVWYGLDNATSRVIAFMVLGILFITISTLYTKKYGNNILGELSFENLKDNTNNLEKTKEANILYDSHNYDNKEDISKVSKSKTKNMNSTNGENIDNDFMKKLEKVSVDDIKVVRFFPNKSKKFTIRASNLIKLTKLVTKQTHKDSFMSGELEGIYNYVVKNYKSNLSRREYDKLRSTVKVFIDEGGKVEIVKK